MGKWMRVVAGVPLMLGLATPVTAAPPAAPTTTTLTRGALTIHPLGASGDSWSAFNAAGAGLWRARTLANLVDAIMTIQCRGAGLAGDLYLLPCLPGDI